MWREAALAMAKEQQERVVAEKRARANAERGFAGAAAESEI